MTSNRETLSALFDAERSVRTLHATLLGAAASSHAPLVLDIREATRTALALVSEDESEASLRLVRIAGLLGDLEGAEVVDLLIDILGSDAPEARVHAGEALESLAFDRFKEVALGIERSITRLPSGSPALTELPFLLAEVGEPGCVKLLGLFLKHADADAVASAIEALAELGDPSAIPLLGSLEKDGRQVQIDEDAAGENERVAIGDLAFEAREMLEDLAKTAQASASRSGGPQGAPRHPNANANEKKRR